MVFETLRKGIKNFNPKRNIAEYKRIIKIANKPSNEELKQILRISGLGMIAIGMIGFIIQITFRLIESVII